MKESSFFAASDIARLEHIYKKLAILPNNEPSFTQMESMFYDTLFIARHCGYADFLTELKKLQSNIYLKAQRKDLTSKMRVSAIRRFKNVLRQQISLALKKFAGSVN